MRNRFFYFYLFYKILYHVLCFILIISLIILKKYIDNGEKIENKTFYIL